VVSGRGAGAKRGILVDSASRLNVHDVELSVTRTGAVAGTYYGAEVNHASAVLAATTGRFAGDDADASQTSGELATNGIVFANVTANGKGLSMALDPAMIPLVFADQGDLPSGTRYLRPGTATANATEVKIRLARDRIIFGISVRAIGAPGSGHASTFTVRVNGVDTIVAATIANAATSAIVLDRSMPIRLSPKIRARWRGKLDTNPAGRFLETPGRAS
jgi:hypothetical protein